MDTIPEQIRMNMVRFGGDYLSWTLDEMMDAFTKEVEIKESYFSVFKTQQQKDLTGGNYTTQVQQGQKERMGTASALFNKHQHLEVKKCSFSQSILVGMLQQDLNQIESKQKVFYYGSPNRQYSQLPFMLAQLHLYCFNYIYASSASFCNDW